MSNTIHEIISSDYYVERMGNLKSPNHPALGIEIEVENGGNVDHKLKWWHITEDGSLRNEGREFVSKGPVPFDDRELPILEYLEAIAPQAKTRWQHNYRTSIHVHINVAPLTREQFSRLLKLYMLVEGTFFRLGGEWRRTSPYCVPLDDAPMLFSRVLKLANSKWESGRQYWEAIRWTNTGDCKYCAFGLFRLRDLCTVELRMHEGTNDHARLMTMLDACTDLYAMAACEEELMVLAGEFAQRYDPQPYAAINEQCTVDLWMQLSNGRSTRKGQEQPQRAPRGDPFRELFGAGGAGIDGVQIALAADNARFNHPAPDDIGWPDGAEIPLGWERAGDGMIRYVGGE